MYKTICLLYLIFLQISCFGVPNENESRNINSIEDDKAKLVTIAVRVKPQKGAILNIANQFYDNLELRFFNDTTIDKTIYRTISISKTKLVTHFGVFMPNKNTSLTFQHAFLLSKRYDTVHIAVTDSLDIYFSNENTKSIFFIDDYTNELASIKNVKSLDILNRKKQDVISKLSSSSFSINEKREIGGYIRQTYIYSFLRISKNLNPEQIIDKSFINSFENFLNEYDSLLSPNLQLLEIFRILKTEVENKSILLNQGCKSFKYVTELRNCFKYSTAQAFLVNDLKNSINKNDSCWKYASEILIGTPFYINHRDKIDSVLFKRDDNKFNENISKIKLLDSNKNNIDLQKYLLTNKKSIYLIDFWATWCIPCIKENQVLKSKINQISNQIGVIKISLDDDNNFSKWRKMIKKDEINFKAVGGFENQFCKELKLYEIPRYVVVNSIGEILNQDFGRPSEKLFVEYLNAYLK